MSPMNLRNLTTAALLILHGLFLPCTHCNTYEKVAVRGVVYLGVFQGLHNQRRCVEYAMLMADRLGYAVLLPQFRLNWVPDTADDDRVPFGYLFDVDKLRDTAKWHNMTLLEHPSQLDDELVFSCMAQLARHHGPWPPVHDQITRQMNFWQRALVESAPENRPRTVCMDDVTAFLGMIMYKFIDSIPTSVPENERLAQWQVDGSIRPSKLINQEVDLMMDEIDRIFGTRNFVALHLRTEDDEQVGDFLRHDEQLPRDTVILVCSGHAPLPSLCDGFRCFQRADVWTNRSTMLAEHPVRELHAYLDYALALRAQAFYGNELSSFSLQLNREFGWMQMPHRTYNDACDGGCGVPEFYQVPECENTDNITACSQAIEAKRAAVIEAHAAQGSPSDKAW